MNQDFSAKTLSHLILETVDEKDNAVRLKCVYEIDALRKDVQDALKDFKDQVALKLHEFENPPLQNVPDVVRFAFEVGYGKDSFPEARAHAVAIVTEYLHNAVRSKQENAPEPSGNDQPVQTEILADEQPGSSEVPKLENGDNREA